MATKHIPRIAVALPDTKPWGMARFFNGLNDYTAKHDQWKLTSCPVMIESEESFPLDFHRLKSWRCDGIILQSDDQYKLEALLKMRIPIVNICSDAPPLVGITCLMQNHYHIGQMAAEYFLDRGFKNLAYHGVRDRWYSTERLKGFKETATKAKAKLKHFSLPHMRRDALWNERFEPIKNWLKTLPLPVGLLAVSDYRALILMHACHELGLRVPEDIALMGVDNDSSVCDFCTPTLSSIDINGYRIGYEAAKLLDRILHKESIPTQPVSIEPDQVVERISTDVLHIADPVVGKAVGFMRSHYGESFKMDTVADVTGASRRLMEMRFRAELKESPAEFLSAMRVEKAKAMLAASEAKSLDKIAQMCGFGTAKNLRSAFRRILGASPSDFKTR